MEKRLLDGVYLYDNKYPDPNQVVENFKSASASEKEKFYKELESSGNLRRNPFIEKVIQDYEYERALSS